MTIKVGVIPAKAGIQKTAISAKAKTEKAYGFYGWIPASAGMTRYQ